MKLEEDREWSVKAQSMLEIYSQFCQSFILKQKQG